MKYCLLLLLALPTLTYAQKVKNVVDKLSGDTTKITSSEKIYGKASFSGTVGEQLFVTAAKAKDLYVLSFSVQTGKTSIFSIEEGQKAYIKYENGTVDTLIAGGSKVSNYNRVSYGSNNDATYILSSAAVQNMASNKVGFIRIESSEGFMDYSIKDKFADQISTLIKLLQ